MQFPAPTSREQNPPDVSRHRQKAKEPPLKLIIQTFLSVDGVMQAPGAPEEDPQRRFRTRRLVWSPTVDDGSGAIVDRVIAQAGALPARPQDVRDLRRALAASRRRRPVARTLNGLPKYSRLDDPANASTGTTRR